MLRTQSQVFRLPLTRIEFRLGLDTLTAAPSAHHALADLPDRHVLRQIYCGRIQVLRPAAIIAVHRDQALLADEIGQGDRVHRRLLRDAPRRDGRDIAATIGTGQPFRNLRASRLPN